MSNHETVTDLGWVVPKCSKDPINLPEVGLSRRWQDLEAKFEAAANLIAKGTTTKGSAGTDAPRLWWQMLTGSLGE